jgi:hypothetical protein
LIELLVALAVFASMAALAYGGLNAVVRTRVELSQQQEVFNALMRSVASLERDLRQAAGRSVRGNYGEPQLAFAGTPNSVELTRAGFANPQAEVRSNLERHLRARRRRCGAAIIRARSRPACGVVTVLRDQSMHSGCAIWTRPIAGATAGRRAKRAMRRAAACGRIPSRRKTGEITRVELVRRGPARGRGPAVSAACS